METRPTALFYLFVCVYADLCAVRTMNFCSIFPDVSSFQSAARAMEGQFLFGYTTGKIASDMYV